MKAHDKMMRSPKWNTDEDMIGMEPQRQKHADRTGASSTNPNVHVAFFFLSEGSTIHLTSRERNKLVLTAS